MTRLRLTIANDPGAVPDYMTVKELSEVMERERAEARAAVREFRVSRTRLKAATASYRAARRSYWRSWGRALAYWRKAGAQARGQGVCNG